VVAGDREPTTLVARQVVAMREVGVLVEAELAVVRHDAWGQVPAFTSFVLRDAVQFGPR
jgi:hypothetical protein